MLVYGEIELGGQANHRRKCCRHYHLEAEPIKEPTTHSIGLIHNQACEAQASGTCGALICNRGINYCKSYELKEGLRLASHLQQTLLSGFDFLVAPLVHPR